MYQAKDIMNTEVITLREDATIEDAIRTLLQYKISGTPVIDEQHNLVGIISEFQLIEAFYTPEIKREKVRDSMSKDVVTVEKETVLSEIANLFVLHRIRRVPVVYEGKVVGIIARRDLLRHIMLSDKTIDDFHDEVEAYAGH